MTEEVRKAMAGETPAPPPVPRAAGTLWLPLTALAVALAEVGLLLARALPLGIPGVWVWPQRTQTLTPAYVAIGAAGFVLLAALTVSDSIRKAASPGRLKVATSVVLLTVAQGVLVLGLAFDEPDWTMRIAGSTLSDAATGYYSVATQVQDPRTFLGEYATRLDQHGALPLPPRVATHPPGPTLAFWALQRLLLAAPGVLLAADRLAFSLGGFTSPDIAVGVHALGVTSARLTPADGVGAILVPMCLALAGSLCVPAMYWLSAQLFDRRAGLMAALLAALIPALSLFLPSVDSVAAALALTTMAAWVWATRRGSAWLCALTGSLWSLGMLWTYGLGSLVVPVAAVWWVGLRQGGEAGPRAVLRAVAPLAIGLVLPFAALWLTTGYQPLAAFRGSMDVQRGIMHDFGRSYAAWVPMNLWDVLMFWGGLAPLVIVGLVGGLRGEWTGMTRAAAIGALAQLAFLLVSGETRGEVGRIWLPQTALLVPFAAPGLARATEGRMLATAGVVVAAQLAFVLGMYATVRVVGF